MTDESGKGTEAPSEFEAISNLIKDYHEAAQETDRKVIELLENLDKDLNNINNAAEGLCKAYPQDFGAVYNKLDEIRLSIINKIDNKNIKPASFWIKVSLAIAVPTFINIISIIMNLSGIRLFYW